MQVQEETLCLPTALYCPTKFFKSSNELLISQITKVGINHTIILSSMSQVSRLQILQVVENGAWKMMLIEVSQSQTALTR